MDMHHYIRNHEYNYGEGTKFNYIPKYSCKNIQSDLDFVVRAIFYGDIHPLKKHKVDYSHVAEFYIHCKLLDLQREFRMYDKSYQYVQEWAYIRSQNMLNDINQIRQRYWYYKPLKF